MKEARPGLICAKLKVPAPRRNYIRRTELMGRLAGLTSAKVTVIKGSAGSGKTTLLCAYFNERPQVKVRWVSLDESDNQPLAFWSYVLAALAPDLGEAATDLRLLLDAIIQQEDLETLLVAVVNSLQPADDLVLVLDDAHHLTDPALSASLNFFVRYSAKRVHLVFVTREEPRLYLGDLRMAGQLLELEEGDLRVSPEEGQAFLTQTLGLELDAEVAAQMNDLAEGWIGGLQLIAVAFGQREEQLGSLQRLNRYMVEYLSGEILHALDEHEKAFLVSTAILSYFDEAACRALLGSSEAGELLGHLMAKNLFLIAVDEERGIYRYHHLFGEFLKLKFQERPAAEQQELHQRAARHYEATVEFEESVHHYLAAGDPASALRLIGQIGGIKSWHLLKQVPLEALEGQPDFIYQRFFSHFGSLELVACQRMVSHFQGRLPDPVSNRLFDLFKALSEGQPLDLGAADWSLQVLQQLDLAEETKAALYLVVSMAMGLKEEVTEALALLAEVERIELRVGNPYIRYFALLMKGQLKEYMGDLRECEAIYREMFRLAERHPLVSPLLVNGYIGIAGVLLNAGRFAEAQAYLEQVGSQVAGHPTLERAYWYNQMELHALKGERAAAAEVAERLLAEQVPGSLIYFGPILRYLLLLDQVDDVLLSRFSLDALPSSRCDGFLLQARLLRRSGQQREALALLDKGLGALRKQRAKLPLVEALLLKVQLLTEIAGAAERDRRNALREAVHYSYENRLVAPFLLEGERIAVALRRLRAEPAADFSPGEQRFLDELFAYWQEPASPPDLLSERELEVLQVLAEGATNKLIGERLYISLATVKTHIINIYAKLQVANRVEAVERARQLGLLG